MSTGFKKHSLFKKLSPKPISLTKTTTDVNGEINAEPDENRHRHGSYRLQGEAEIIDQAKDIDETEQNRGTA